MQLLIPAWNRYFWPPKSLFNSTQNKAWQSWWRHQMETFSALLAICAGNSPVPVEFPHKGQWRGALMFSLICVWISGWVNNRKAGDLRRYRIHYDVIVMIPYIYAYFMCYIVGWTRVCVCVYFQVIISMWTSKLILVVGSGTGCLLSVKTSLHFRWGWKLKYTAVPL